MINETHLTDARWAAPLARSFLLTPNPGRVGTYEEISRPTTQLWHKLSVSPSETKVAYMLGSAARRRGAERWLM